MHNQDANNFLSLAAAMKILLARTVDVADLPRARQLLQNYLDGFLEVCYPSGMTLVSYI